MWNIKHQGSNQSMVHGDWLWLSVGRGEKGKEEEWWVLQAYQGDRVSSPDIFVIAIDEMLQGFRKDTCPAMFHNSCISNTLEVWKKTAKMGVIWPVCKCLQLIVLLSFSFSLKTQTEWQNKNE